ncbi:protocatechuate 3,4-dioxygenase subunit alpha [Cognatiyoonia sp. IB215182]|uniref:protocatechuate 3,4-dioxygenase subunit alpha n=1 Tax=Cognatiyoonia sp. IB215182 TaxID=3097353 RepID=UPI002A130637|nr:protocatechuate 3,4-dioxygenase subunit alpha [Cognatiyoonia sp. IB215182]MDX8354002.1 protocatechuate 3,4-dioxygenase subunit alpha [Cognatiyoonia sp. IB215182]
MALKESPSQTAGPYVHIGCAPKAAGLEPRGMGEPLGENMVPVGGERVTLDIKVFDGEGAPVKDALIEIWQAGPDGRYAPSSRFQNWGRQPSDLSTGVAQFKTLKPGASGDQAPHILVWIVARGINLGLTTRIYFPDEDNSTDPVFALAGERAETLLAIQTDTGYAHTIRLQGENETVFFDV